MLEGQRKKEKFIMRKILFLLSVIIILVLSHGIAHAQRSATNDDMWHQNLIEDYKKSLVNATTWDKWQGFAFLVQPELFEEATPEVLALLDDPDFENVIYIYLRELTQSQEIPLGEKKAVILRALDAYEQDILSQTPEALIDEWHTIYKDKGVDSQMGRITTIFYIRSDADAFKPLVEESQTIPEFSEAANEILSGWDALTEHMKR